MELAKKLPDEYVDLLVTSPPYADTVSYGENVEVMSPAQYVDWFLPLFKEAGRFLKKTGSFILNINDRVVDGERQTYVYELVCRITKETNLKLFDRYIWYKKSALPMTGDRRLNDRVEYIFHFVRDPKNFKCNTDAVRVPYKDISLKRFKSKVHGNDIILPDGTAILSQRGSSKPHPNGSKPITVFEFESEPSGVFRFDTGSALRGNGHPAPFHPDLPSWFIKWLTNDGDVVLDPFMGGGTVAESALKLGRNYIGFEINPKYIAESEKRINKLVKEFGISRQARLITA